MKQILFTLGLCSGLFCTAIHAQSKSAVVINSTGCTVHFSLYGNTSGGCGVNATSGIVTLPGTPGGVVTYAFAYADDPLLAWGLDSNDRFVGGVWLPRSPMCSGTPLPTFSVGEPCSSMPPFAGSYYIYDYPSCGICNPMPVNVLWTPSTPTSAAIFHIY